MSFQRTAPRPSAPRPFVATVIAAGFLLLLGACAAPQATRPAPQAQPPQEPVLLPDEPLSMAPAFYHDGRTRVALLAPLSGEHAGVGQALVNAAQMALFDVADDNFALSVKDTNDAAGGVRAAMDEARREGAQLILGPLFAQDVREVRGEASLAGVPLLAFSNDSSLAGAGIYVMGLTPSAEVERVVGHAVSQGRRRIGLLAPRTAYGEAVTAAVRESTQRFGGELVEVVTYDPRAPDFSEPVREFARRGGVSARSSGIYDAVMVPAGGRELLSLAALLPYYDVDPQQAQYLGTRLWEDATLGAEPALSGGWFAAPARAAWEHFSERYQELYGARPPRVASVAYDATALAAVLVQDAARNGGDVRGAFRPEALHSSDGFAGVDGLFRLRPDGRVERGLAIYELRRGGFDEMEPAPTSFVPLIN